MGRLNPERRTPPPQQTSGATIGPLAVESSRVGSFVDFLRQATMVVDQTAANPMAREAQDAQRRNASSESTVVQRAGDGGRPSRDDESGRSNDSAARAAEDRRDAHGEQTAEKGRDRNADEQRHGGRASASDGSTSERPRAADDKRTPSNEPSEADGESDSETNDASEADQTAAAAHHAAQAALTDALNKLSGEAGFADTGAEVEKAETSQSAGASTSEQVDPLDPTLLDADLASEAESRKSKAGDTAAQIGAARSETKTADPSLDPNIEQKLQATAEAASQGQQENAGGEGDSSHRRRGTVPLEGLTRTDAPEAASPETVREAAVDPAPTGSTESAGIAAPNTPEAAAPTAPSSSSGATGRVDSVAQSPGAARTADAARTSAQSQSADQTGQVDRARFVQRVARAFHSIAHQGGTVRMKLHPEELGALTIKIGVQNGAMTAQIETESTAAQKVLMENLGQLRERLAEQNIKIDRFEVQLTGQMQGGASGDPRHQENAYEAPRQNNNRPEHGPTEAVPADTSARARRTPGSGLLDLLG